MNTNGTAEFFHGVADSHAALYTAPTPAGRALRERHRRALEFIAPSGGKVLDVGCGPGVLTYALLRRSYSVGGVIDGGTADGARQA